MKKVITYGTYDLLHIGHINLLKRARALGDCLIVGLSTDAFNLLKHKDAVVPYAQRKAILESLRSVDHVIPEKNWEQKAKDIKKYKVDTLVMGADWKGKFDHLRSICTVVYLPRTPHVSTSARKAHVRSKHHG
ncbi:MAG: glycerol-3-phosphate cytidylyltransferase [Patescibacteria group bacterium]